MRNNLHNERQLVKSPPVFGRFGMRIFKPKIMDEPHSHGHIELNFLVGGSMTYEIDGKEVRVPPNSLVCFWANIAHRLSGLEVDLSESDADSTESITLANVYYPLDAFLSLPYIAKLQMALLGGGMLILPDSEVTIDVMQRWYRYYRTKDIEHLEILKMEIHLLLRRASLFELRYLAQPNVNPKRKADNNVKHIHFVVSMTRYILENLTKPISNSDVAAVTGLHQNYALNLFSGMMHMPVKRFILRMRLYRACAMLVENNEPISVVAEASGFTSTTQFYQHFSAAYKLTPKMIRQKYRESNNKKPIHDQ